MARAGHNRRASRRRFARLPAPEKVECIGKRNIMSTKTTPKKRARGTAKKVTVRDLEPRRKGEVKGGVYSKFEVEYREQPAKP